MRMKKALFERMFRGKTKIPYKFTFKGQDYRIAIRLRWRYAFFLGFMAKFSEKTGKDISIPDQFEAGEKTYPFLLTNTQPTIDKIIKNESKKVSGLKLLNAKIERASFKREGKDIILSIIIKGLCRYDV